MLVLYLCSSQCCPSAALADAFTALAGFLSFFLFYSAVLWCLMDYQICVTPCKNHRGLIISPCGGLNTIVMLFGEGRIIGCVCPCSSLDVINSETGSKVLSING